MSDTHDMGAVLDNVRTMFVNAKSGELELSEYVENDIGTDNMLGTDGGLYIYSGTIWEYYTEERWKHRVQRLLKKIPDIKLTARKVSSVANLLKTDAYRDGFQWPHDEGEAVACPNGVARFDGAKWILQPHQREDYLTSTIPVEWQPDAQAPRFIQFLSEVFKDDSDAADKADALLEMIGYTLMRHTRHERFIIIVGRGANGKSVLLFIIAMLIGSENIAAVSPDQLDRPFQRAALYQKLANIITELKQGEQVQDGALKSIVSGEPCTVERKFGHPFTMCPYATQWYGTNHLPHTRDFSFALFRRALIVPFNNRFTGKNADPDLSAKLKEELPGILRLALTAYGQALQRGSFTEPDSCRQAKDAWRLEADQVHRWAEENVLRDPGDFVLLKDAYGHYREWAEDVGIRLKVSKSEFSDRMDRLDFQTKRRNIGISFEDVRLKR